MKKQLFERNLLFPGHIRYFLPYPNKPIQLQTLWKIRVQLRNFLLYSFHFFLLGNFVERIFPLDFGLGPTFPADRIPLVYHHKQKLDQNVHFLLVNYYEIIKSIPFNNFQTYHIPAQHARLDFWGAFAVDEIFQYPESGAISSKNETLNVVWAPNVSFSVWVLEDQVQVFIFLGENFDLLAFKQIFNLSVFLPTKRIWQKCASTVPMVAKIVIFVQIDPRFHFCGRNWAFLQNFDRIIFFDFFVTQKCWSRLLKTGHAIQFQIRLGKFQRRKISEGLQRIWRLVVAERLSLRWWHRASISPDFCNARVHFVSRRAPFLIQIARRHLGRKSEHRPKIRRLVLPEAHGFRVGAGRVLPFPYAPEVYWLDEVFRQYGLWIDFCLGNQGNFWQIERRTCETFHKITIITFALRSFQRFYIAARAGVRWYFVGERAVAVGLRRLVGLHWKFVLFVIFDLIGPFLLLAQGFFLSDDQLDQALLLFKRGL